MVEASGFVHTDAGVAVSAATVNAYFSSDTSHGTSKANTTTDSLGFWSLSGLAEEKYDFKIVSGSSIRWELYKREFQLTELEVATLKVRNPGDTFVYDILPAAIAANRTLTLPLITGTDTLATLGLAATFSAIMTHSADVIMQDAVDLALGTGSDALLRWSTGDASNHALAIGLGDSNQGLHITDKAAIATDWNITATTHPNVYIHSNTTPATDYLRLGDHDGTTAYVDVVGGTTLAFEIAGGTEMSLAASSLTGNVVGTGASQVAAGSAGGIAKGWCHNSADGATVNDSLNLTSLTDSGVGSRTYVWATDFGSGNYVVSGSATNPTTANIAVQIGSLVAGSAPVVLRVGSIHSTAADPANTDSINTVVAHGDQ